MSTWLVVTIIVIALAFIIGTITALLKAKPFHFSEEYEESQKPKSKENDDDDNSSGLI
ncbi:MAG: hypothetical protein ACI9IT_002097 [Glaciecola sp.]|jgi:hypothetical protein